MSLQSYIVITEFYKRATGPYPVCVNGGATLTCVVQFVFDDGMAVTLDAVWTRDGFIIDSSTPRHDLIKNSMIPPRVVGVLVKDIEEYNDGTVYTCTVDHAPDYFNSSYHLFVSGMDVFTIFNNMFCTYIGLHTKTSFWFVISNIYLRQ